MEVFVRFEGMGDVGGEIDAVAKGGWSAWEVGVNGTGGVGVKRFGGRKA